jgi:hypothetical protein
MQVRAMLRQLVLLSAIFIAQAGKIKIFPFNFSITFVLIASFC